MNTFVHYHMGTDSLLSHKDGIGFVLGGEIAKSYGHMQYQT